MPIERRDGPGRHRRRNDRREWSVHRRGRDRSADRRGQGQRTTAPEMWVGANGTNMTINLEAADKPVAAQRDDPRLDRPAARFTVATGHTKYAAVVYSQTDDLGDPANEIATPPMSQHDGLSLTVPNDGPCNFTIKTRTGKVALIARDPRRRHEGTPLNARRRHLHPDRLRVQDGPHRRRDVDQAGVDAGGARRRRCRTTSPSTSARRRRATTRSRALVGIDLGRRRRLPGRVPHPDRRHRCSCPRLAAFAGGSYRLIGIATHGQLGRPRRRASCCAVA